MGSELQKALSEFIVKMIEALEKGAAFAQEQIPDVIQQALTWFMVKSLMGFCVGVIVLAMGAVIARKVYKNDAFGGMYDDTRGLVICFIVLPVTVVGLLLVYYNLDWIQILIAPKWFIISEMYKLL